MLCLGQFTFQDLIHQAMTVVEADGTPSASEFVVVTLHVWIGAAIAVMVLYRLYLRQVSPVPVVAGLVPSGGRTAKFISIYHIALYLAVLFMAGTGAVNYYLGVSGAAAWHRMGKWAFGALVLMHVSMALWHWKVQKNKVLQRMLGTETSSNPKPDH